VHVDEARNEGQAADVEDLRAVPPEVRPNGGNAAGANRDIRNKRGCAAPVQDPTAAKHLVGRHPLTSVADQRGGSEGVSRASRWQNVRHGFWPTGTNPSAVICRQPAWNDFFVQGARPPTRRDSVLAQGAR
jgi:hypothetical protein